MFQPLTDAVKFELPILHGTYIFSYGPVKQIHIRMLHGSLYMPTFGLKGPEVEHVLHVQCTH